jgi:hypothetical protein
MNVVEFVNTACHLRTKYANKHHENVTRWKVPVIDYVG